jgi:hypothetical protein
MKKVTLFLFVFIAACLTLKAQDSLQQYVAKYKFPPSSIVSEVNVVLENGTLQVTSAMGNAALEKTEGDKFLMPAYNGMVVFIRNEAKKITGIKIDIESMNISIEGVREEKDSNTINRPIPFYKPTFPIKYLPVSLLQEDARVPILSPDLF